MNIFKVISILLSVVLVSGCASMNTADGPHGPELVANGRSTESGHYAEIGLEFSTWGDFTALVSPKRWSSPIATGGSLSWLNPVAWSDDAGRTGRILLGEALIVGGTAAAVVASDSGGGSSGSGGEVDSPEVGDIPPPPDGGTPPPSPF